MGIYGHDGCQTVISITEIRDDWQQEYSVAYSVAWFTGAVWMSLAALAASMDNIRFFFSCHRRWAHHTTYFKHFDLEHTGACVLPGVVGGKMVKLVATSWDMVTWVATTAGTIALPLSTLLPHRRVEAPRPAWAGWMWELKARNAVNMIQKYWTNSDIRYDLILYTCVYIYII